jgi:hypothetical protein
MELETDAYRERMQSISDVYLRPPVQQYRFNDFKHGKQIAERAYKYACEELWKWIGARECPPNFDLRGKAAWKRKEDGEP